MCILGLTIKADAEIMVPSKFNFKMVLFLCDFRKINKKGGKNEQLLVALTTQRKGWYEDRLVSCKIS